MPASTSTDITHVNLASRQYMNADADPSKALWSLVGMPYDGTCSFRPGTRFGPNAVREASWGVESFCPRLNRTLETMAICDRGDIEFPFGNRDEVLKRIYDTTKGILSQGQRWAGIGGEHLVTFPVIQAHLEKYPDLAVIQFDAHADLREDYLGETLSHATVMRRVVDLIGPERFLQIGIRSGTQDEFEWMRANDTLMSDHGHLKQRLQQWGSRPVFLTIDLDVLDPSILPGTGTPEPGGLSFRELQEWMDCLDGVNLVGFDAVELSPPWDASGVSTVAAAKVIRHALLLTQGYR